MRRLTILDELSATRNLSAEHAASPLAYPVVSANRKPSRRRFKLGATYGAFLKQADKET
jgi:hypothetical protein